MAPIGYERQRIREIRAHQPMVPLFLDSGATHHMVGSSPNLSNLRDLHRSVAIRTADGSSLTATRSGDISIRGIEIKDVYLVPGLEMNLISVPQLAGDDIVCTFRKNYVDLSKGDELVGGGMCYRGLYQICYLDATGDAAPARAASGNHHHAAFAITGDDNSRNTAIDWVDWKKVFTYTHKSDFFYGLEPVIEPIDKLLKLTAQFNLSDEAGGGVSGINKGTDGTVLGKAHLGSDGMPMADFLEVLLNEILPECRGNDHHAAFAITGDDNSRNMAIDWVGGRRHSTGLLSPSTACYGLIPPQSKTNASYNDVLLNIRGAYGVLQCLM